MRLLELLVQLFRNSLGICTDLLDVYRVRSFQVCDIHSRA